MNQDFGKLLLRLSVGGLLILHGVAKIRLGIAPIESVVKQHGLPGALAYLVYFGEVIAPFMVIIGYYTRVAALAMVINMVVAIWFFHSRELFQFQLAKGGGYALELQMLYLFGSAAIFFLGSGRYSASRGAGRWN
jgi:putative oxidoreductase